LAVFVGLARSHRDHGPCSPCEDRKAVAAALAEICRAMNADTAIQASNAFADGDRGIEYPAIAMSWRRHWPAVIPSFAFPSDVRRIIYTTDEIDKRPMRSGATISGRGRPRGEERGVGCKLRRAA
jgi:putative transposase